MRNLIICADGTWNTPDQKVGDIPTPTNVVRISNAIAKNDKYGGEQLCYYHPGVGTEGTWWEKKAGGAIGVGLDKNIKSAYKWLCQHYRPEDRIFLFGFSRGAYTVRSLVGMIGSCGLLDLSNLEDEKLWKRVKTAYKKGYRKGKPRSDWAKNWPFHPETTVTCENNEESYRGKHIPIYFLGVWDTVGALGIPNSKGFANLFDNVKRYSFHDTKLGCTVKHARHAVALDEKRDSFSPTLWNNIKDRKYVKQIWFPGVHCNVGGGYVDTKLADIALNWMIKEATDVGLNFKKGITKQIKPNSQGILYDSVNDFYKYLGTTPRSIPLIIKKNVDKVLHGSVMDRQSKPPIESVDYHPTKFLKNGDSLVCSIYAIDPWNSTGIYLKAGKTYLFEANGQWMDSNIKCGPGGTNDDEFYIGEIVQTGGTLWGKIEEVFKKVTNNEELNFSATKRNENIPWFALVGSIANGGNPKKDGTPAPHETFKVGDMCKYIPKKSGYFYAYANDAWNFYENNRGSVTLKITRLN